LRQKGSSSVPAPAEGGVAVGFLPGPGEALGERGEGPTPKPAGRASLTRLPP